MPQRAKLTSTAPILLTRDVQAAAQYYTDKVGFEIVGIYNDPPNFSIIKRNGNPVMLAQVDDANKIIPNWKLLDKTCDIYFWVDNIDALYSEIQERGAMIDFTLYDTPWGTREFGIQDLDEHDICFGQIVDGGEV